MTIIKLANRLSRWRAYRNTYRALSALDSRQLDDLGIMPGDIGAIARRVIR